MHGGRLVAERLAAARRQHHDGVAAVEDGGDGLGLQREQAIVTPDAPDGLVDELSLDDGGILAERYSAGRLDLRTGSQ
jgi:hypothetical protein